MDTKEQTTPNDQFDRTIENTADHLDEIASQTLADPEIQEALANPEHDEDW